MLVTTKLGYVVTKALLTKALSKFSWISLDLLWFDHVNLNPLAAISESPLISQKSQNLLRLEWLGGFPLIFCGHKLFG